MSKALYRRFILIGLMVTAMLLAALLLPAATALASNPAQATPTATITTGTLNVRAGNSPGFPVVGQVQQGDVVKLLARDDASSWVKIQLGTMVGWISSYYITPGVALNTLPVEAPAEMWGIIAGVVNMRSGPGATYDVIVTLQEGLPVGLVTRNDDASWLQVRVPNQPIGWVSSAYITPGGDILKLPLVGTVVVGGPGYTPMGWISVSPKGPAYCLDGAGCEMHITPGFLEQHVDTVGVNETVNLLGRDSTSTWYYIHRPFNGSVGWAFSGQFGTTIDMAVLPEIPITAPAAPHDHLPADVRTGTFAFDAGSGATQAVTGGVVSPGAVANPTTVAGTGKLNGLSLNLRLGPDVTYGILQVVPDLTTVNLLGRNRDGSWLYVSTGAAIGFINSGPVVTTVNIMTLPEAQPIPSEIKGIATVATPVVNVRAGPNTSYAVLTTVEERDYINLLGRVTDSSWAMIRTMDGIQGWIATGEIVSYIPLSRLPIMTPPSLDTYGTAVVNTGSLNLRSGPDANATVLGTLAQGDWAYVMGRNADNTWVKIRTLAGVEGWVSSGNVDMDVLIGELPIVG